MTKSKPYTNRSNCVRAAKVALGKSAKPGVEFTIEGSGKEWFFTPTTRSGLPTAESNREPELTKHQRGESANTSPKTKRRRAPKGQKSNILEQPAMKAAWSLAQRKTGVTVAEGAERTESNKDTFRGKMSVCKKAGCPIRTERAGRQITYHLAPEWAP